MGAALLLGFAQTSPGKDALVSLGLRSDHDGYTELSFAQPGTLPRRLAGDATTLRVPFLVRNVESSSRAYAWTVERRSDRGTETIASGRTGAVPVGRSAFVAAQLPSRCAGDRNETIVRVAGVAQTIDFWSACKPAKAAR